jgi:hypothetical protein
LKGAGARRINTISRDGRGKREGLTRMKLGKPYGEGVLWISKDDGIMCQVKAGVAAIMCHRLSRTWITFG